MESSLKRYRAYGFPYYPQAGYRWHSHTAFGIRAFAGARSYGTIDSMGLGGEARQFKLVGPSRRIR